jgi:PilZ domain-containing protein
MSSTAETQSPGQPAPLAGERRQHPRHSGKAKVEVIREGDTGRSVLPVELYDLSTTGLGLVASASFAPDERLRIRLRNDIRRIAKEVRGVVRWAQLLENGKFRIGIELYSRLTALDVQLLKQVGTTGDSNKKVWI